MSDPKHTDPNGGVEKKKPYEPPRVLETAEFETLALNCVKIPGDADCELTGTTGS